MDEEELARLMRLLALTEANRRSQEEQQKLESIRNEMAEANRLSHEEQQKLESIRNETAGLRQAATEDEHRQKSLPQCPACGGRLDGEFRKCKHCASDLVWIDHYVCEPGQEEALRQRIAAEEESLRQRIAAEQEAIRQRKAAVEESLPQLIAAEQEAIRQRLAAVQEAADQEEAREAIRQRISAEVAADIPEAYQLWGCAFAVFIVLCMVLFVVVPSCLGE